ncbi:uncharacterized protein NPIL_637251 [Nephila pilipes]|uniref:Uncharacterized protein n=1 Tax=Nephila pilipes TaxID=299642 RepID=A0A8X6MS57_NEPPI|nr:uncharacterized protein NPIL_637251 [Nephila pilipes]
MYKQVNLIEKTFLPILLLFHIAGLELLRHPGYSKQNRFRRFIWKFPQYLFNFLQCLVVITQLANIILLSDKNMPMVVFVFVVLPIAANLQTRRSRKQIRILLMKLWKCAQMLHCGNDGQKFQIPIFVYCASLILLNIIYILSFLNSNEYTIYRNSFENSDYAPKELKQYFTFIPEIGATAIPIASALVYIPLTGYYGFVCFYVKFLFNRVESCLRHSSKDYSYMPIVHSYVELINIMKSLDDYLSFSAFAIVLSAMSGLFHLNYHLLILSKDGYLHTLVGEIYFSVSAGMVILSASAANSAFVTAKEAVFSLPFKISHYYKDVKMVIWSECARDVSLTLWNIYKIERSLIFSAIGTLVTYGILVGNLGRR